MNTTTRIIAIFDFDGTITTHSTTTLFLKYVLGWQYPFYLSFTLPMVLLYKLNLINLDQLNNHIVKYCLKGYSRDYVLQKGQQFSQAIIPKLLRKEAIEKIKYHQALGHFCILATAAYDVYIEHWAKLNNFDAVVCSHLAFDHNHCATGKLSGLSCSAAEKLARIKTVLGDKKYIIYAYGDSRGNQEMLAFADYSYYRSFDQLYSVKNNT